MKYIKEIFLIIDRKSPMVLLTPKGRGTKMTGSQISPKADGTSNNKNLSVKCIFCKSTNYIKWGKRATKNRGIIQTYKCKWTDPLK